MSVDTATVRRIARLARIAVSDDEEARRSRHELNTILGFVEQLNEVDIAGVEPMTSVTPMKMKMRADVVTEGDQRRAIVANAPARERASSSCRRWSNRRPHVRSHRPHTLPRSATAWRPETFSAGELARAHLAAIEAARALNAFIVETPEKALAMAANSDRRSRAARPGRSRASRSASRTCSAPRACTPRRRAISSTASSRPMN